MATQEAAAIHANIVGRIESVTAPSPLGGRSTFAHVARAYGAEDLVDLKGPTRRFVVADVGGGPGLPLMVQTSGLGPRRRTYEVVVAYRQGEDGAALVRVMSEDADALTHELQRTDGDRYDETTTKLWRRVVESSELEMDAGTGGVALLRMAVACDYLPTT